MNPQYSRYYTYIKPLLKNPVIRTYGSFVFSLITITIFTLFAIRPTLLTIASLQKSIDQHKEVLTQLNTKIDNLTLGQKNFDNLDPVVKKKLLNLVPASTAVSNLIDSLAVDSLALQASISGLQLQPVELVDVSKNISKNITVKEIDFTLNAQGSYTQLTNFIDKVSKSSRLIYIKSINFNKSVEGSLLMTMNAKAYFLKL